MKLLKTFLMLILSLFIHGLLLPIKLVVIVFKFIEKSLSIIRQTIEYFIDTVLRETIK